MNIPRLSLCLICILLAASALATEDRWTPFGSSDKPVPCSVEEIDLSSERLTAEIRVPGMHVARVPLLGEEFARIRLEGGNLLGIEGAPSLPVIRRQVEVPRGAHVRLRLIPAGVKEWSLASLGLPQRLLPTQPPVPKLPGADEGRTLHLDRDLYASGFFWPATRPEESAVIAGRGIVRGRDLLLVELRPVSINPAQGRIRTWSSAELIVETSEAGSCDRPIPETPLTPSVDRDFALGLDRPAAPGCDLPDLGVDAGSGSSLGAEGMMVIVADAFESALDPWVDWKRKTGFRVEVVTLSDLGGSPTDVDIKNRIQQAYDTWSNPSLSFVLMVGDTDFTPIHQGNGGGNSQVTDNWYVCLDGSDYLPDAAISRISTRSAAETSDVVDKLLVYQQASFTNEAWTQRAGFIGTSDGGYISLIEDTHDDCIDSHYTPNGFEATSWSHGYASSDRHYNSFDADTSEIAASINEGRTVVNYSGHGSETSWQGPTSHGGYGQSDVRNNNNDGMYPFVISNACITGTLNRTECFGETWQKEPNKGSIAFLGASNNSYWDEDDYYERRLHAHIFPTGASLPIGVINNRAKIDLYNHYGDTGTMAYYFDMYNMLSEPSLQLWTRRPRLLDVEYDPQVPTGSAEFTVTVRRGGALVEGALVAIRKTDEGVFAAGYTDASGSVVLPLDPAPVNPGSMEVTVTGRDDRPHLGSTEIIPVDGPWLRMNTHRADDSLAGCDSDGMPDIGETVRMTITLENIGSEAAVETRVWLDSTADIAVLDNPVSVGVVPSGELSEVGFDVRIGAGVSCEQTALFTASWECFDCEPGDDTFAQDLEVDLRADVQEQAFEEGGAEPADWSHQALAGTDDWQISAASPHGGSYSYYCSGTGLQKENVLVSERLHPEGQATLRFWQRYELTELKSGGYLEISRNDGGSWQDAEPLIVTHPYDSEVGQGIEKRRVWNGDSGGWRLTVLDLSSYAGEEVRLRFHLGTLNGSGAGWWIDDLHLESVFVGCDISACGVPNELEITSVTREGGQTLLEWWDDPVAARFLVHRSYDPTFGEAFEDVTHLDNDDTDARFRDSDEANFACWIVQGKGPDGDGPWGHFGW